MNAPLAQMTGPAGVIRMIIALMMTAGFAAFGLVQLSSAAAPDSPASLIVNVYTCDALHDPIAPNQTLVNECNLGTEDITFALEPVAAQGGGASASTGTGGAPSTISFTNLAPNDYRLVQQTPDTIALSYISQCTSTVREFTYPFTPFAIIEPGGRLNIQLLPGEELTCDWYNIQASDDAAATTLTAAVYSCDGDVIDPNLCDPAPGIDLRLSNPSAEVIVTSDTNGIATFDGAGTYTVEAISDLPERTTCGIYNPGGSPITSVALDPANPSTLEVYYCYPGA